MTHDWKALYAAAMLETDKTQVQHRIEEADAAITARLLELPNTISASAEKMELQSALAYLCRLKGDSDGVFQLNQQGEHFRRTNLCHNDQTSENIHKKNGSEEESRPILH